MIDYKESKKAKRSVLSKEKVITREAVEEVQDSKGNVVQEAQAEESYSKIKISTKAYNPKTGSKLADQVVEYMPSELDSRISDLQGQIDRITAEKESWEAIKADYEALDSE
jgi:uncharacterized small protein (DUF1192 family)